MNKFERIEQEMAYQLICVATDYVESYVENEDDWDAAVSAVLARALELASGWKLKDFEDIFIIGEPYESK